VTGAPPPSRPIASSTRACWRQAAKLRAVSFWNSREVLAVGPGARDENGRVWPLDVTVGNRVLFGKWSGTEVLIDGEDRLIMKESDILGVIEPAARATAAAA